MFLPIRFGASRCLNRKDTAVRDSVRPANEVIPNVSMRDPLRRESRPRYQTKSASHCLTMPARVERKPSAMSALGRKQSSAS